MRVLMKVVRPVPDAPEVSKGTMGVEHIVSHGEGRVGGWKRCMTAYLERNPGLTATT